MESKTKAEKIHFRQRCLERTGCLINQRDIVKKIQANKLKFIERQSNRITVWLYEFMDNKYKVIYDKQRKVIVTIIPID